MPAIDEPFNPSNTQVKGCESQAWLYHELIDDKDFYHAYS
ncbi:hypothetical protein EKG38_04845 [Shewanella canadensis]|uniref:Uncharacterized protein n=1 Tax=Shewanella canadensis TaxID=271096 RepID=A0A3S0IPS3_9GAMM|nr:hypothetical protein EKG38_04845 [Shewanella canadensis]